MSIPNILLVQFRHSEKAAELEYASVSRELAGVATIITASGLLPTEMLLPLSAEIGGVILGGSGDLDFDGNRRDDDVIKDEVKQVLRNLTPFLTYLKEHQIPTLGICFGHQLIGAYHGVAVEHDCKQSKTKTHQIKLTTAAKQHPIFTSLPDTFAVQYGHKDVIVDIPLGAKLLAHGGEACRFAAIAYSDTMITTQFHPELSIEDLYERVAHIPNYLPQGVTVDDIYQETPYAGDLLRNFAKVISWGTIEEYA
jgi:GMP synthase-like glutamine amidotransferase